MRAGSGGATTTSNRTVRFAATSPSAFAPRGIGPGRREETRTDAEPACAPAAVGTASIPTTTTSSSAITPRSEPTATPKHEPSRSAAPNDNLRRTPHRFKLSTWLVRPPRKAFEDLHSWHYRSFVASTPPMRWLQPPCCSPDVTNVPCHAWRPRADGSEQSGPPPRTAPRTTSVVGSGRRPEVLIGRAVRPFAAGVD